MPDLFLAVSNVLDRILCPIHYREATRMALEDMNIELPVKAFRRAIEDVREKMLLAERHETTYIPSPYCYAVKKHWFSASQSRLVFGEWVFINGNARCGANACYEGLMRSPYMLQKIATASPERINRARANGLSIEKHVSDWFASRYPEFYLPPDNDGRWQQWCCHDFRLKIGDRVYGVDVAGVNARGTHGNTSGKKTTDFHLDCELYETGIRWLAVFPGQQFKSAVVPEYGISPQRFLVWMHCYRHRIPYGELRKFFGDERMAA
jgi:hypothetical protein